jgi:hypothetical protein
MHYRLRNELQALGRNPDEIVLHLFDDSPRILPTHNAAVRRAFESVLRERGIGVHTEAAVVQVSPGRLRTARDETFEVDEVVWVTRARGAIWLRGTGLELDADGFIRVTDTLQTITDPDVFAAGDIASMVDYPLEKAGVFAVRQGPPLAENLRRAVDGRRLRRYRPQRRWLALISTGDRRAVASRGLLFLQGDWVGEAGGEPAHAPWVAPCLRNFPFLLFFTLSVWPLRQSEIFLPFFPLVPVWARPPRPSAPPTSMAITCRRGVPRWCKRTMASNRSVSMRLLRCWHCQCPIFRACVYAGMASPQRGRQANNVSSS